jgi:hypothetical protein
MKTKFDYVHFEYRARGSDESKKTWCCVNNKQGLELGVVVFYSDWRMYVFIPTDMCAVFSPSCLRDIASFVDDLTKCRQNT